jgi:hypothetical protein
MKIVHAGGSLQRLTEGRVGNTAGRNQLLMARPAIPDMRALRIFALGACGK